MASDTNSVTISGSVTRTFPRDSSFGFGVKVTREDNGKTYSTIIDCVAFKPLCETLSIEEGDRVTVKGALRSSSYEKDGVKVWKTQVIAFKVEAKAAAKTDEEIPF